MGTNAPELEQLLRDALGQLADQQREIEEIRCEFVTEDGKLGTGTMTEAEIDANEERTMRLNDEHLIYTFLALNDVLSGRLTGRDRDVLTMSKTAALEMMRRSIHGIPVEAHAAAWRLLAGDDELDLTYLDYEEA